MKGILLIAEDSETIQSFTEMLSPVYTIYKAMSLQEGASTLRAEHDAIAATLIELGLARSNNYAFSDQMQAHSYSSTVPAIAISKALPTSEDVDCLEHGYSDLIASAAPQVLVCKRIDNAIRAKDSSSNAGLEQREAMERNQALTEALAHAEEASEAKTAFLGSMSHEIRTPLNAIIGLDNIALRDPSISETTRDELRLKQVLINILGNAVKFTPAPGTVTAHVEREDDIDGVSTLRFTITDTGIGMDKAFLPKLFEAFSQEDVTATSRYGGSGLGMAITKNMVDLMGGRIEVDSEKGHGTTFTVHIPLRKADDAQIAPKREHVGKDFSLIGLRILIVEDMEMNADILADLLELEGASTEWAQNGQIAVDLFDQSEEGHFDAILMDMRMPVMDGTTAARTIRLLDRPDAATIPIIALTANAFEEDVKNCLQAGMDAHLSKPVDVDQLVELLGRMLQP